MVGVIESPGLNKGHSILVGHAELIEDVVGPAQRVLRPLASFAEEEDVLLMGGLQGLRSLLDPSESLSLRLLLAFGSPDHESPLGLLVGLRSSNREPQHDPWHGVKQVLLLAGLNSGCLSYAQA
jgi:hypothetical protein